MRFHLAAADLLKSETKFKIIKFLLNHEAAMSEREIASVLKISHMSVNRTMRELAALHLAAYVTVGKAHLWKVNRQSFMYGALGELVGRVESLDDPLTALKQTLTRRLALKSVRRVVLFGSIARGAEKPDSDIDVFILIRNNEQRPRLEKILDKLSLECLEKFGNRLSPYVLTEREFQKKKDLAVMASVAKGIQLYPRKGGSDGGKI